MNPKQFSRRKFLGGAAALATAASLGTVLGRVASGGRDRTPGLVSMQPGGDASVVELLTSSEVISIGVGSGPAEVGVRVLPDAEPEGPQSVRVGPDGSVWIVDTLNSRIHSFSPAGSLVKTIDVPEAVFLEDVALLGASDAFVLDSGKGEVRRVRPAGTPAGSYSISPDLLPICTGVNLDDKGDLLLEVFARDSRRITSGGRVLSRGQQEAEANAVGGIPMGSSPHNVETQYPIVAADRRAAVVQFVNLQGETVRIPVSVDGGLPYMRFLGVDAAGNIYVEMCELLADSGVDSTYDRTVRRYSSAGQFLGAARVPATGAVRPRRDLAVSPDGRVYYLRPLRGRVDLVRLEPSNEALPALVRTPGAKLEWEEVVYGPRSATAERGMVAPSWSRSQSYYMAIWYANWWWYCSDANYYGYGCTGRYRPSYLVRQASIQSVPYQWGGFKTVDEFNTDMNKSKAAGDVHCDYWKSCASGVDCSGYVSRTWALSTKRNTAGLISLCQKKTGFGNLQQGDLVAKPPNDHSRYFVAYNYPPTGWSVLESTVSYGGHVVGKFYLPGGGYTEYHYPGLT